MYINISLLEQYFKNNGQIINTNIDIESSDPILKFVLGEHRHGSRVEFLEFSEMNEILIINNILGDDGLLIKERDSLRDVLKAKPGAWDQQEKKMETLVYDTLAKYIIQMFYAGTKRVLFPSLIPLQRHKDLYFRVD
jgi:hypothetical protein